MRLRIIQTGAPALKITPCGRFTRLWRCRSFSKAPCQLASASDKAGVTKLEIGAHRASISRRSRFSTLEPSTLAVDGHRSASPRSEQDSPTVHERWRTWANITKMSGFVVTFVVTAPFSGSLEVFLPMKRGGGGNRICDSGPRKPRTLRFFSKYVKNRMGRQKEC